MSSICTKHAGRRESRWKGGRTFILELLCLGVGDWNCRLVPILENATFLKLHPFTVVRVMSCETTQPVL